MRRTIVAASLGTAALLGGTGVAVNLFSAAGANAASVTDSTTTDSSSTSVTATLDGGVNAPAGSTTAPAVRPLPDFVGTAISDLVTKGTLTQAQADAVTAALQAAQPAGEHGGRGGPGGGPKLDAAATALGITSADLKTELDAGKTIAAVATEKGVDVTKVVDALVAEAKTHLAADVTAGKITQAEADTRTSTLTDRITQFVNNTRPAGGGMGRHGDGDGDGPGAPPAAAAPGSSTAVPASVTASV